MVQSLKYTLIRNKAQYLQYCDLLESLLMSKKKSKSIEDEIDLLTLLIEKYDEAHHPYLRLSPGAILKSLLIEHKMKSVDLAKLLGISEGLVSDMISEKKSISKKNMLFISKKFKVNQHFLNCG
jgi:HTH-type transcriptional regulator/antitoxin HigA